MTMDELSITLERLERCVTEGTFESLEGRIEIKPAPATGNAWNSIRQSVCGMLNHGGGVLVLGVKEVRQPHRHYAFTGYTEDNSGNLSELTRAFTDAASNRMDLREYLKFEAQPFLSGRIAIVRVRQLDAERRFCQYQGVAYERILDRDEIIDDGRVAGQEEYKQEMEHMRELTPVPDLRPEDLSLQRINEFVHLLNQGEPKPIETFKGTIAESLSMLDRRKFVTRDGRVTTLGALVCADHVTDLLQFRCVLDAFVIGSPTVAQEKKTYRDNVIQLMEAGYNWTLRTIRTGVSHVGGGTMTPEYPTKLIRECINNALAHRDYSENRPVQISVKPGESLNIRNPGRLPADLILDLRDAKPRVLRIFATPKARNPRLADILKLHEKWEGKGIGMSDLTNFALGNEINLPYYLFHSERELSLTIPSGKVLDEPMETWFTLHDAWIAGRTGGRRLSDEHRIVLAYLLKSERLNRLGRYTIALHEGNNHASAISQLVDWGLVVRHHDSHDSRHPYKAAYIVARELADDDCHAELQGLFGHAYDELDDMARHTLNMVALAERYSSGSGLNAKQVSRLVTPLLPELLRKLGEDEFYRAARRAVEKLSPSKKAHEAALKEGDWVSEPDRMLEIKGPATKPTYKLNRVFDRGLL